MRPLDNLIRTLGLVAAVWSAFGAAQAGTANDVCTGDPAGALEPPAANIRVGRDAQAGDLIGPWLRFPTHTYTCKRVAVPPTAQFTHDVLAVKTTFFPDTAGLSVENMINVDGNTYRVYRLKLARPGPGSAGVSGLGYIARIKRELVGHSATEFEPVTAQAGELGKHEWSPSTPMQRPHGHTFQFKLMMEIRLVKLQGTLKTGNVYTGPLYLPRHIYPTRITAETAQPTFTQLLAVPAYRLNINIESLNAACITPDDTVALGEVETHDIPNVNDRGPSKTFTLKFNQCPNHMHSIRYRFDTMPASSVITDGILPLSPDPATTAAGVGVQVLDRNNAPLVFNDQNAWAVLSEYESEAGGARDYRVPMKAHIIRTPGPIQAGQVQAQMKMVVEYQ